MANFRATKVPGYADFCFSEGIAAEVNGTWFVLAVFGPTNHPVVVKLDNVDIWEAGAWCSARADDFKIYRPEQEPVDVCEWEDCSS